MCFLLKNSDLDKKINLYGNFHDNLKIPGFLLIFVKTQVFPNYFILNIQVFSFSRIPVEVVYLATLFN